MNLTSDWGFENSGLANVWLGLSLSIAILVRVVETLPVVCRMNGVWSWPDRPLLFFQQLRAQWQAVLTDINTFKNVYSWCPTKIECCKETISTEDGTSWKWVDIQGGPVMILFNLNALDASLWKLLQRLVSKEDDQKTERSGRGEYSWQQTEHSERDVGLGDRKT